MPFLQMPDHALIPDPPLYGMLFICQDLRQGCSPASAADDTKAHVKSLYTKLHRLRELNTNEKVPWMDRE